MTQSELEAKLEVLREMYLADHAAIERSAKHPSQTPANTCRYCGIYWKPYPGSRLDGHTQCLVSERFKRRLVETMRHEAHMTYPAVGKALGVSKNVVRAWWLHVESRAA